MRRLLLLLTLLLLVPTLHAQLIQTPGWHKMTATALAGGTENSTNCPSGTWGPSNQSFTGSCSNVINAWGGAVADTTRNRLIMWGGGHADYGGNELYDLELSTSPPTFVRLNAPSPSNTTTACVETLSDGRPNSRHTYDGLLYMPNVDQMISVGGSLNYCGFFSGSAWSLNMSSVTTACAPNCSAVWTQISTSIRGDSYTSGYDPTTQLGWFYEQGGAGNLYSYNGATQTFTLKATFPENSNMVGVVDPVHEYFVELGSAGQTGAGQGIIFVSIANGSAFTFTEPTPTGPCSILNGANLGAEWDPIDKVIRLYNAGLNAAQITLLDPATWTCTTESYGSTQGTDFPQGNAASGDGVYNGTFGRWGYFPGLDAWVIVNDANNDAWYMHPRRAGFDLDPPSVTQTNLAVSQPLWARQGDIPSCPNAYLNGVNVAVTQGDNKNRWPDGSWKFGIVSLIAPSIPAGSRGMVRMDNQGSCNNTTPQTQAQMLAAGYNFDGQIQLTGTNNHNISARAILTAASSCSNPGSDIDGSSALCSYWLQGPVVTAVKLEDRSGRTFDVSMDGATGNPLHPIFEAWFWPSTNQVQLGYTLEDDWASATTTLSARDQTMSVVLTGGNTSPVTEYTNSSFSMLTRTRWHKTFCINGANAGTPNNCFGSTVHVDHRWPYLAQTKIVPNWDPAFTYTSANLLNWTNNQITSFGTNFQGNGSGIGGINAVIDNAGAAPWHGPLPTWDIYYLLSQCDAGNATAANCGNGSATGDVYDNILLQADINGRIPYWYREADTQVALGKFFDAPLNTVATQGRVISINARQEISLDDVTNTVATCHDGPPANQLINFGGSGQDIGIFNGNQDYSHAPNTSYVAYLSTGQYAYYEQTVMQSAYAIGDTPGNRGCIPTSNSVSSRYGPNGYWLIDGERDTDWLARDTAIGAFIAVDGSPEDNYFTDKLKANLAVWEGIHSVPCDITGTGVAIAYCGTTSAWTYGNTIRRTSFGNEPAGPNPLGSWTSGLPAYSTDGALTQTGSPNSQANAHFQENYSVFVVGFIDDLGFCPHPSGAACGILQFAQNHVINEVLNPNSNMFNLRKFVYYTVDTTGAGLTTWSAVKNQYVAQETAWNGADCQDEANTNGNVSVLSYGASNGIITTGLFPGLSAVTAYNTARAGLVAACGVSPNNLFGTGTGGSAGSPKWDMVPRVFNAVAQSVPASPTVQLSPTSFNFGSQNVSTTSSPTIISLSNVGTASLSISSITITGTNPSDFSITNNTCGTTLPFGSNCAVTVVFTPQALASRSANLTFTTNAPTSPDNTALSGTGTPSGSPAALFSPTSVAFGSVKITLSSTPNTVTLKNTGTVTMNIASIALIGTNSTEFSFTTTCGSTLAVNATCNINATFSPISIGSKTASISVTSNTPTSPDTVPLTGTGTAPIASLNATAINFFNEYLNTTSVPAVVVLTNTGSAVMNVNGITLSGLNAANFAQTNTCSATLGVGASCNISLTFNPSVMGPRAAQLNIADDSANSPQIVTLAGIGVQTISGSGSISGAGIIKVAP